MKKTFQITIIAVLFLGCSANTLTTKTWHTTPSPDIRTSTIYPYVEWEIVQELRSGMSVSDAKTLVHNLQSYHHPINAIVFSSNQGQSYEIALKFSKDKTSIVDISYKSIERGV